MTVSWCPRAELRAQPNNLSTRTQVAQGTPLFLWTIDMPILRVFGQFISSCWLSIYELSESNSIDIQTTSSVLLVIMIRINIIAMGYVCHLFRFSLVGHFLH